MSFMSPRPRKHRKCNCPLRESGNTVFKPAAIPMSDLDTETIFHDEVEAVHLCDGQGLTQEEAGGKMGVSRGTVQRLVKSGRRKIIHSVVAGKALIIDPDDGTRADEGDLGDET